MSAMYTDTSSFYEAMQEVLLTSRYDLLTGRRVPLRTRIMEWFFDLLDRMFSNINLDLNFMAEGVSYNLSAVPIVFIVIGAILLVVAGIAIFRVLRRSRMKDEYDLSDIFEELAQKKYSINELIQLSDNAENRRIAIRYRYIAALLSLNEKQIIEIKPSATNAIILKQIKGTSLFPIFESTADVFHRAWFGYKNISDTAYENFASVVQSILQYGDEFE